MADGPKFSGSGAAFMAPALALGASAASLRGWVYEFRGNRAKTRWQAGRVSSPSLRAVGIPQPARLRQSHEDHMLEFFAEHRGPINTLLVLAFACCVPFNLVLALRRRSAGLAAISPADLPVPPRRVLSAVNVAGAIGIGILWTMLVYKGPSLPQLWLGAPGVSHWTMVLMYTMFWLPLSPVIIPETSAKVTTAIAVRGVVYGAFFLLAIVGLNDW
jgi:hypothetical protein